MGSSPHKPQSRRRTTKNYSPSAPTRAPQEFSSDDNEEQGHESSHIRINLNDVDSSESESHSPPNIPVNPLSSRIHSVLTAALPKLSINQEIHMSSSKVNPSYSPQRRGFRHLSSTNDMIPMQDRNGVSSDSNRGRSHSHLERSVSHSSSLDSIYRAPNLSKAETLNAVLYRLLEDPSSSTLAFYVSVYVSTIIVSATVVATLETIPALYSREKDLWAIRYGIELYIIITFSFEYILRIISRSDSLHAVWNYVRSPLGIIDLLAVAPYWVELASQGSQRPIRGESAQDAIAGSLSYVFRTTILKAFRLLSMFRVFRYSSLIQLSIDVLIIALRRSLDALSALLILTAIVLSLFSTLLFFAERGTYDPAIGGFVDEHGRPSTFDSIPRACWFVLSTLTTTGYGDMVPQTFAGKIITIPIMMCGVLLIALPSIVVGRNFAVVYEFLKARREGLMEPHSPNNAQQPNISQHPLIAHDSTSSTTNATTTEISPNTFNSPLPGFAALFDDPFSLGAGVVGPLPRDTQQLITYVAALSIALTAHQSRLHEAIAALKENIQLDQILNTQEIAQRNATDQ